MLPTQVWTVYGFAIPASIVLMISVLPVPLGVTALLDLKLMNSALQGASVPILQHPHPVLQDICALAAAQHRFSAPQARIVWLECLQEPSVLQECTAAQVFQLESLVLLETHALLVRLPRSLARCHQILTSPAMVSAPRHRASGCVSLHIFSMVLSVHLVQTTLGASLERRTTVPPTV